MEHRLRGSLPRQHASNSIATFRPSTYPASLRPSRNAATMGAYPSGDAPLRNPITGFAGCCARPGSGRAAELQTVIPLSHFWTAEQPTSLLPPFIGKLVTYVEALAQCGRPDWPQLLAPFARLHQ